MEELNVDLSINYTSLLTFIAYLLVVILIGVLTTRFSSKGVPEFFIGGRRMNRFVVALSAVVSGRSSWLLLGVSGMAYQIGASAVWAVTGYIIMELFLFLFYARRLRRFSEKYDCITLPDFFVARFGDNNHILRLTLTSIILIFMISYISAQFVAGGKAFSAGFGLESNTGLLVTATIVLLYTMLGGFLAVSITDMVQACFMILALLVLPVIAIMHQGGLDIVLKELQALDPRLIDPLAISFGVAIGFLGIGLGSPGNPHIIARYMSIKDAEQLRTSAIVGTIWNVLMAWGALFIGLAGRVYFPEVHALPGGDTENLYPFLAQHHLHPLLFGMVIASIFAAIMSTADSQLLVAASGIVRDIYEKIIVKGNIIEQKRLVILSRLSVFFLVAAAIVLALTARDLVFWLVLFAWAGLGASLGPTSVLALYWRRCTRAGILAGLLTGTITTIVWYNIPPLKSNLYELIPAFFLSLIVTMLVSKFTVQPAEVGNKFKAMKSSTST